VCLERAEEAMMSGMHPGEIERAQAISKLAEIIGRIRSRC
jgi:hypothetical protein